MRTTLAPGEHPDLPALVTELYEATDDHPAYGRYLIGGTRVICTANPARIRRHAHQLLALADLVELAPPAPGQQSLEVG